MAKPSILHRLNRLRLVQWGKPLAAAVLILSLLTLPSHAIAKTTTSKLPILKEIRVRKTTNSEFLELRLSAPVQTKRKFNLNTPDRLVIDFSNLEAKIGLPQQYKGNLIKKIRFGSNDSTTIRAVIELSSALSSSSLQHIPAKGKEPYRVVITLNSKNNKMLPSKNIASKPTKNSQKSTEKTKPFIEKDDIDEDDNEITTPKSGKPTIVIDAGHGGKDPGTQGTNGSLEKNITLAYAKAIREQLLRTGRYNVLLTRDDDRFILLHERVNIARKAKAALFISIHADSAPSEKARGLSLYTVSETASDKEAEALAERENKSDIISGMDLSVQDEKVAGILIELAQRETKNKSATFAKRLSNAIRQQSIHELPGAHRFAGFRVLKAPDIASVLIEIGFLSNASEEKLINSIDYRTRVAKGVLKGVDEFFSSNKMASR